MKVNAASIFTGLTWWIEGKLASSQVLHPIFKSLGLDLNRCEIWIADNCSDYCFCCIVASKYMHFSSSMICFAILNCSNILSMNDQVPTEMSIWNHRQLYKIKRMKWLFIEENTNPKKMKYWENGRVFHSSFGERLSCNIFLSIANRQRCFSAWNFFSELDLLGQHSSSNVSSIK